MVSLTATLSQKRNINWFARAVACSHRHFVAVLTANPPVRIEVANSRRARVTTDRVIRGFFGSNALVAIVVLALITIFLFREGSGFFEQNLNNIRLYRRAGLEFVDIIKAQAERHSALSRELNDVRLQAARAQAGPADLE